MQLFLEEEVIKCTFKYTSIETNCVSHRQAQNLCNARSEVSPSKASLPAAGASLSLAWSAGGWTPRGNS